MRSLLNCHWSGVWCKDDELAPPNALGRGNRNRNTKGATSSSAGDGAGGRSAKGGGRGGGGGGGAPKIENLEMIADGKSNILMLQVEGVHSAFRSKSQMPNSFSKKLVKKMCLIVNFSFFLEHSFFECWRVKFKLKRSKVSDIQIGTCSKCSIGLQIQGW